LKTRQFWIALLTILIIIVISIGNYQRWWDLRFPVGPFSFTHWLGWFGAGFIATFAPLYSYIKHHTKDFSKTLLTLHVFGNLVSYLLVSIHFTQQAGRPAEFAAVHSTGLTLYIVVTAMVLTGFFQRFGIMKKLAKSWRFIHVSLTLSIYVVLAAHILQFFDIL
jgi:hypothetical protein